MTLLQNLTSIPIPRALVASTILRELSFTSLSIISDLQSDGVYE